MIEKILPPAVSTATAYDDSAKAVLFPEEEAVVRGAVDKRYREFATVRWCARRALAQLHVPPVPIVPGERGAPHWPDGIVGSMTHCEGYRAAAVARIPDVSTIGIDAELHKPLPDGVLKRIARDEELAALRELRLASTEVCWDGLLFSAKESVYKAWFPVARQWLGFEGASLTLHPEGTFTARLLVPEAPFGGFAGRWIIADGILATAIVVLT